MIPRFSIKIGKKQYVWSQELTTEAVEKRLAQERAEKLLGVVFLLCAGLGIIILLILAALTNDFFFFESSFWFEPNLKAFLFLLSVIFCLLSFYHIAQKQSQKEKIPRRLIRETIPSPVPFELDVEQTNITPLFSQPAQAVVDAAFSLTQQFGHTDLEPIHLFVSSLSDENVSAVLGRLQISFEKIKDPLSRRLASRQLGTVISLSEESEQTLISAFANSYQQSRNSVGAVEIFFEAFKRDQFIQELFFDQGVSNEQLENMVEWVRIHEKMRERYEEYRRSASFKPIGAMNRAMTAIATPTLDVFSEDLTTAAVQGRLPILVDREKELEEIFRIIEGGRESVVLVGPDGVGKETILDGIAQLMAEERVPVVLQDKRLVRISIPQLISGTQPAEAQERLMQVLYEAIRSGNILLSFVDLDQLTEDFAPILVDFLSRSGTFAIATSTLEGYTSVIERSVLGRVFQKVLVSEPESREAIHVLESKILGIEAQQNVTFTYMAIEKIVQLSDRFMHESYLPFKAIELAKEAALMVVKAKGADAIVTDEDVAKLIAEKTGIPTTKVEEKEKDILLHLEERMHDRVVGQEEAVIAVASALRRARTQLSSQKRPIATFLFLGPTGVGKTELAKTVAESYFGSEENMIRFDMSEYQQKESSMRLIDLLTESVRQKPFALILLDEFEKAHPDILNLFLQVFDDGRLTDTSSRTIDFTNTIIISTSNAGTQFIQDITKFEEELKNSYRPELLNRFDGVIVFHPLTQEQIVEITRRLIEKVSQRLEAKGIHLRAEDEVITNLAQKGYDPEFGARPLRRLVQEEVDNAIANALLEEEVKRRDTIVLETDGIRIEKAAEL
ncbi:ATP-dependent Clp protease ATP-binding subunit [Candidatus Uhrbacteria bacterium]|nr:ATP-dependent Clp protease ATP-binding subunit [Candidatus Uhrbacteria bacterium]